MRARFVAVTLLAVCAPLALAMAQEKTPEAPQVAPSGAAPGAPARAPQNSAPQQGNTLATPEQQSQAEQTLQTKSGQGGKEEPSTKPAAVEQSPALADGKLNVPGAPADSQTVPAKFSERNDAIDKLPIMAMPLGISPEQERAITASVKQADAPVAAVDAKVTQELPGTLELRELSDAVKAQVPAVEGLKYVRLSDRILLVRAPNMIVVGEIKG